MILHKEIKRARKESGYTQEEFAKKLEITREHYNSLENQKHEITLDLLKKIDTITGKQLVVTFIDKD